MSWKTIQLLQGLGDRIGAAGGQVLSGLRQARLDEERKKRLTQQDADRELQRTLIYKQNPDLIPGQGEGTSNVPRMRTTTTVTKAETPLGSAFEREHPDQFVGPPTPGTRTTYDAKRVQTPVQIERTGAGVSPEQAKVRAAEEAAKMSALQAGIGKARRAAGQDELAQKKFALDEQRQRDLQAYRGKRLEATSADDPAKLEAEISRRLISAVGKKVQAFGEPTPELDQEIETLRAQLGALRGEPTPEAAPAAPEGPKPEEIAAARRDPAGTIDEAFTVGIETGQPFDQIAEGLAKLGINIPPDERGRLQQLYQAKLAERQTRTQADADVEARRMLEAIRGYGRPPVEEAYPRSREAPYPGGPRARTRL